VGVREAHHHDAVVSAIRRQCAALGEPLPRDIVEAPKALPPTLRFGASGPAVRKLQELLVAKGASITIDASFGPATRYALAAFQARAHLATDSIAGPATWLALAAP
jgi:peptidoglycan hydrolase-like protein with peptidoglycan-binding domain